MGQRFELFTRIGTKVEFSTFQTVGGGFLQGGQPNFKAGLGTLLKKLITACGDKVTLLSQHRTEAGGLTPMIFILRVNG